MAIRVTVVGSADAFNSAGRGNAAYLVEDGEGAFCVDFGPTALMGLKRAGFEPERLDAVFLTHLHGDHFGGLHLLFIDAQYRAVRRRPLIVGGPLGTAARIEAWYKAAYGRAGLKRPFETRYLEWEPGETALAAGRHLRTFAARHMHGRDLPLHLRIRTGKAQLAFTGDTGWSEALPELAAGADLMVCECTDHARVSPEHLSWEELEPRLDQLKARRILLTHLGEEMRRRSKRLRLPKRVTCADDGEVVRIAARR